MMVSDSNELDKMEMGLSRLIMSTARLAILLWVLKKEAELILRVA